MHMEEYDAILPTELEAIITQRFPEDEPPPPPVRNMHGDHI